MLSANVIASLVLEMLCLFIVKSIIKMEMRKLSFEQLKEQIMQDEENQVFTEQGIEPLFWIPETAKILIIGQSPGLKAQESRKFF